MPPVKPGELQADGLAVAAPFTTDTADNTAVDLRAAAGSISAVSSPPACDRVLPLLI